ncbi:MAG: hypothetical protein U1E37_08940 [Sphingomonadaceae bacterium]
MPLPGLRLGLLGGVLALAGVAAQAAPVPPPPPAPPPVSPPPMRVAKDEGPAIYLSPDGATVYVIGVLSQGSFFKFDQVLLGAPKVKRVYLASIGGLIVEGRLLAALVRKRRLDTYVEYYCASACTQVFVAGRDRAIGQDAQLGFHQAVVVDKDGQAKRVRRATERTLSPLLVFGVNGNDTLRLAYEQAGIDEGFIARVLAQPHSDMWTPTVAELQAAKVVTRLAAPGEVPLPPGGTGQAEVSARLAAKPLWRESARAYPADYGRAVGEVWRWANSGIPLDAAIGTARLRLVEALTPRLLAASDIQLEGLLAFRVRTAREQRETGYPLCGKDWLVDARATDPRMAAIEDEEDRLLAAILASPPAVTPPSREVAMNTFASEVMPVFAKAYRRGDAENGQGACRYTYRIFETIAELPDGKRIRAYRAMLALPKFLP